MIKLIEENRIVLLEDDVEVGVIGFTYLDNKTIEINRTFVNPIHRNKGIADKLMRELIELTGKKNLKCIATCSYAKNWFVKHPQEQSLLNEKSTDNM